MPHGSCRCVPTIPNTRDKTAPNHGSHIMTSGLDKDARPHNDGEKEQHAFPPQLLADKKRNNRTRKAAQVIDARDEALHSRAGVVEVLEEVVSDYDAATFRSRESVLVYLTAEPADKEKRILRTRPPVHTRTRS